MSFRVKPFCSAFGATTFFGATYAQCFAYSPPCSTHFFSSAICRAVSCLFDSAGGMRSSASSAVMRYTSALSVKSFGTTARSPLFSSVVADLNESSRSPAFTCLASGPWQA